MVSLQKFSVLLSIILFTVYYTQYPPLAIAQFSNNKTNYININHFIDLTSNNKKKQITAVRLIDKNWDERYSSSYSAMILESMSLVRNQDFVVILNTLLRDKTKQDITYDINAWFKWIWSQPYQPHPDYAQFKSILYSHIDPLFFEYFDNKPQSKIRLDEIRWGGVLQDGIPPLRQPTMVSANKANYLQDSDIIFGIEINNDVRAYPKRILAWHEMFVDDVGGITIAGVYCTLCGTVIIYDTKINEINYTIGTSGFLYRSNKLMYDKTTQSLWSTFSGSPVVGPLVDKKIKLPHRYVVTTTWAEWKKRHPNTKVLSLNTGYNRDYGEGVAYKDYFSSDALMFNVPILDTRLKNKDEILGLIFNKHPDNPLAISVSYLFKNPIYHDSIKEQQFVAFTDKSGAIRVYETKGLKFTKWDKNNTVIDQYNIKWTLSESMLSNNIGNKLYRLAANRAFWFGWFSAYNNTRLVM